MKFNLSRKGFTLVEIMIVVVIIGLLAALAIPAFKKVRNNSIEKTLINDARQISNAVQQICSENSTEGASALQVRLFINGGKLSSGVLVAPQSGTPAALESLQDNAGNYFLIGPETAATYFILQHLQFDKTISTNNTIKNSAPATPVTQIQFSTIDGQPRAR